ncbi:ChaN family lipoprotein [Pseudophaeobacter flagellatus]|uniref:ChaN family lipoprotein n=1 Tax=Pseudophaeobacter flagellatus TaxID=2899119 RepID=UPI001E327763|nr:ChaN family lipoprotein [Pseudophaeobacter flagellatus]MCD9148745.1 ChaN family lipoprotein [Pseudophaeobacter flagellatus]
MRKRSFLVRNSAATLVVALVAGLSVGVPAQVAAEVTAATQAQGQAGVQRDQTGLGQVAAMLKGADVILLGEVHDNAAHHQTQAELIAALRPRAVVWEMITQDQAETLTVPVLQDAARTAETLNWATSGWPDFALYAPVFLAASEAAQFGAWLPRAEARTALQTGIADHFGDQAARFGLDQPLPEAEQAAREAAQMVNHCNAMPAEMLPMLVDIQRLRDARLAARAEQALQQTGGPVVVITGNGHARLDWGLAVYLKRAVPQISLRALGQIEGDQDAEMGGQGARRFDVVLSARAPTRPDPCLAFRSAD